MTVTPWEAFAAEVREALAETTRLEAVEDPEATPFKSKEAALELIEAVLTKLQQQCVCSPHTSFPSQGFGRGFSKMMKDHLKGAADQDKAGGFRAQCSKHPAQKVALPH